MIRIPSWSGSWRFLARRRAILSSFATLVFFGPPVVAAIITTGNVTPDPNTVTTFQTFYVANTASGTMIVNGGSTVTSGLSYVGYSSGVTGTATITDSSSKWTTSSLSIGYDGIGNLTVSNGGAVSGSFITVGDHDTGTGTLTVTGSGSLVTGSFVDIGDQGGGTVNVNNGGKIVSTFGELGGFGGTGDATIDGNGSSWTMSAALELGFSSGSGNVTVQNGATMSSSYAYINEGSSLESSVTVTGAQSVWNSSGDVNVGSYSGSGKLNISQGGTVNAGADTIVGPSTSAVSAVNFDNGILNTGGLLTRVSDLHGTGTINTHGLVTDIDLVFDQNNGLQKQFVFTGSGQNITINLDTSAAGSLGAGFRGQGSLTIADGLTVNSKNGYLGHQTGASGAATIDGAGSKWKMTGNLFVGSSGTGALTIKNGAAVEVGQSTSAATSGSSGITFDNGTLTTKSLLAGTSQLAGTGTINTHGLVSDVALVFDNTHPFQQQLVLTGQPDQNVTINLDVDGTGTMGAGYRGIGSLSVADGKNLTSTSGFLGYGSGSTGTATVSGNGSTWSIADRLAVGFSGAGNLTISGGASVIDGYSTIGNGKVTVTGNGSTWTNQTGLSVGGFSFAPAELLITSGGKVISTSSATSFPSSGVAADFSGSGKATIDGLGSNWTHTGPFVVGASGTGTLIVSNGGTLSSSSALLADGFGFSTSGSATITGAGSKWTNTGSFTIGNRSPGTVTIADGGVVSSASGGLAANFGSSATVNISGQGSAWTMPSSLAVGGRILTPSGFGIQGGPATLTLSPGGSVQVGGDTILFSPGRINLQGGSLSTSSIRFDFSGGVFNWTSGTLHVGTYNGNLTNAAGTLSPGQSPGKTTITGTYTQQSAASLQIEIGGTTSTTQYDLVAVTSNTTLGGTLKLSLLNGFFPNFADTFTVLTAGGNLTGSFSNAANGQRLSTSDGYGSFLVYYGASSAFNPKQVVLTSFLSAVPEPRAGALVTLCLLSIPCARRKRHASR